MMQTLHQNKLLHTRKPTKRRKVQHSIKNMLKIGVFKMTFKMASGGYLGFKHYSTIRHKNNNRIEFCMTEKLIKAVLHYIP